MLSSTTTTTINNKLLIHFTITSMTTREITRLISKAMDFGFETVEQIKSDMTHIHSIHHGHIIGKIEIQSRIKIQEIKMKQANELTSNDRILISRLEKNVEICNEIKSEENTDELFLDHFTRYLHHQRSREQEQQREERQSKKNRNIVLKRKTLPIAEKDSVRSCDICMEDVSIRNFVSLGCNHEFCSSCAEKIDKCAMCREPIVTVEVSLCEYE